LLRVVEIEPVTVAFSARVLYRIKKGAKSFLLLVAFFPYDPFPLHLDSLSTHTFCTKLITVAGYPPDPPLYLSIATYPSVHRLFVYLRWTALGDPFVLPSTNPKRSFVDVIPAAPFYPRQTPRDRLSTLSRPHHFILDKPQEIACRYNFVRSHQFLLFCRVSRPAFASVLLPVSQERRS
jgi:hypothetical protein